MHNFRVRYSSCIYHHPQAIAATLRHNPSIWITTLLVFLLLSTGGLLGVFFISANETYQRRQAAEGVRVAPFVAPAAGSRASWLIVVAAVAASYELM